jgi:hypothetical protein
VNDSRVKGSACPLRPTSFTASDDSSVEGE